MPAFTEALRPAWKSELLLCTVVEDTAQGHGPLGLLPREHWPLQAPWASHHQVRAAGRRGSLGGGGEAGSRKAPGGGSGGAQEQGLGDSGAILG